MSGEISQLEIERSLITIRAAGDIAGVPAELLDQILGRLRAQLQDVFDGPPGPPDPPPTP